MKKTLLAILVLLAGASMTAAANPFSGVVINGQPLNQAQLMQVQIQLGAYIPSGNYLLDASGCWLETISGASGCIGSVSVDSRYGSGERASDGSWNHWSNSAGMGVGGTADGCLYTTSGWSNC